MRRPTRYEIRIRGHLSPMMVREFEGLTAESQLRGQAVLRGVIIDQAALMGLLLRLHGWGIEVISVAPAA